MMNIVLTTTRIGNNLKFWRDSGEISLIGHRALMKALHQAQKELFAQHSESVTPPEEIFVQSPALLLLGLGIECYLKAAWLKNGNKLTQDGKFVGVNRHNHDLVFLAEKLEFNLNVEEREVLENLSYFVTGPGRYPIPDYFEKFAPGGKLKNNVSHIGFWDTRHLHTAESIVQRLAKRLGQAAELNLR